MRSTRCTIPALVENAGLEEHREETARVDHEIGRIEHTAPMKLLADLRRSERVVRGSDDRATAQLPGDGARHDRAGGIGREDVAGYGQDLLRRHAPRAGRAHDGVQTAADECPSRSGRPLCQQASLPGDHPPPPGPEAPRCKRRAAFRGAPPRPPSPQRLRSRSGPRHRPRPCDGVWPMCLVARPMTARSAASIPMSPPVKNLPSSSSTARPKASSSSGVFSRRGSPSITALPPPQGMPAKVAFEVMACESRRASSTASSKAGVAAHARPADGAPEGGVVDGDHRAQAHCRLLDDQTRRSWPSSPGEVEEVTHGSWTSSTPGATTVEAVNSRRRGESAVVAEKGPGRRRESQCRRQMKRVERPQGRGAEDARAIRGWLRPDGPAPVSRDRRRHALRPGGPHAAASCAQPPPGPARKS